MKKIKPNIEIRHYGGSDTGEFGLIRKFWRPFSERHRDNQVGLLNRESRSFVTLSHPEGRS